MKTYFIIALISCGMLIVALCVSLYCLGRMRRNLKNTQKNSNNTHYEKERLFSLIGINIILRTFLAHGFKPRGLFYFSRVQMGSLRAVLRRVASDGVELGPTGQRLICSPSFVKTTEGRFTRRRRAFVHLVRRSFNGGDPGKIVFSLRRFFGKMKPWIKIKRS